MNEALSQSETMAAKSAVYPVAIKERVRLTHPSSSKETYHIVLDLGDTPLTYEVGDSIGIYPSNLPVTVTRILNYLGTAGDEIVYDRDGTATSFKTFLTTKANLSRISRELYELITGSPSSSPLTNLELQDLLAAHPCSITPEALAKHLPPLLPRLYSIASSYHVVGHEVHLTVALSHYEKEGERRFGVCSAYLCHQAPLHVPVIPIYVHKSKDFGLAPHTHAQHLIMIGPGTGVAPFRGFMQQRLHAKTAAKHWLFFGERNQSSDFYYQDFWTHLVDQGHLHLDLAFSRDQTDKVYVQHKMLEKAQQLWQWIEEGAILYVCGDAARMAKDVDATLLAIAMQEGELDLSGARAFIKQLRKEKRYLRDVY